MKAQRVGWCDGIRGVLKRKVAGLNYYSNEHTSYRDDTTGLCARLIHR